ncbi:hypothetical protein BDR03DRAFT_44269 [Suillus americanus]|nr:hypothetical protein BDR03DRAFT_44269 [Suillus americanus]
MERRRGKLAASTDPEYESRIQAALADMARTRISQGLQRHTRLHGRLSHNSPMYQYPHPYFTQQYPLQHCYTHTNPCNSDVL